MLYGAVIWATTKWCKKLDGDWADNVTVVAGGVTRMDRMKNQKIKGSVKMTRSVQENLRQKTTVVSMRMLCEGMKTYRKEGLWLSCGWYKKQREAEWKIDLLMKNVK